MTNDAMKLNGRELRRQVEMIGDVEKIQWYELKPNGFVLGDIQALTTVEIYDQEELFELERIYVGRLLDAITPVLPII